MAPHGVVGGSCGDRGGELVGVGDHPDPQLEREFVAAVEPEEALFDDVGRDAALFEILLDGSRSRTPGVLRAVASLAA